VYTTYTVIFICKKIAIAESILDFHDILLFNVLHLE
jgi:hypothetical protein